MLQEIKDIYEYRRDDNSPMLSPYQPSDIDFWKPYRDNYAYFDRMFMKNTGHGSLWIRKVILKMLP